MTKLERKNEFILRRIYSKIRDILSFNSKDESNQKVNYSVAQERGFINFGSLFITLIIAFFFYLLIRVAMVFVTYYDFMGVLEDYGLQADALSNSAIQKKCSAQFRKLGYDIEAADIQVERNNSYVTIKTIYYDYIDIKVFGKVITLKEFELKPEVKLDL